MAAQAVFVPPSTFSFNLAVSLANVQDDGVMFITSPNGINITRHEMNEMMNATAIVANKTGETAYVHYLSPIGDLIYPSYRVGPVRNSQEMVETSGGRLLHLADPSPSPDQRSAIASRAATIPRVAMVTPAPAPVRIPKPRNSWIIYRQEKHKWFKDHRPGTPVTEASKLISAMWKKEPVNIKIHYGMLAAEERELHGLRHPGWKVQPRKSHEIKKRRKRSVAASAQAQTVELGGFQTFPHTDDVEAMAAQVYTSDASFSAQDAVAAFDAEEAALQDYLTNTLPAEVATVYQEAQYNVEDAQEDFDKFMSSWEY